MAERSPQRPLVRLGEETISRMRSTVILPTSLSIVKALIENSVDAVATEIGNFVAAFDFNVKHPFTTTLLLVIVVSIDVSTILVSDNGMGISILEADALGKSQFA